MGLERRRQTKGKTARMQRLYWKCQDRCVRESDEEWEEEGIIVGLVREGRERGGRDGMISVRELEE